MSVGRICVREVDLVDPDESAQTAAARMNSHNVGTLVVLDSSARPVGIVTDRDLAISVVAKGLDPAATPVSDIMTRAPDAVHEETSIEAAISRMRSGPYRRLPVVDNDGRLVGLISLDDILDLLSEEFAEIGRLVRREGPGTLDTVEERW